MARAGVLHSVVTRLVIALVLGGVIISGALTYLEMSRQQDLLRMRITHEAALTARNVQTSLERLNRPYDRAQVVELLAALTTQPSIRAARVELPDEPPIAVGSWPDAAGDLNHWTLPDQAIYRGNEVRLDRRTLLRAPFVLDADAASVEVLIDGPMAKMRTQAESFRRMGSHWLVLAIMTLLGLLLLRRWFAYPLAQVVDQVRRHAPPESFDRLASELSGEFSTLSHDIGGMLQQIQTMTAELQERKRAYENLYQQAPAALLSLDEDGNILEANRRAVSLFQQKAEHAMVGRAVFDLVRAEDRPLLRQTMARLDTRDFARCELRVDVHGEAIDVMVEAVAFHDRGNGCDRVRLSLIDVSAIKELQRQLSDQTRLLNLLIDHMSDAILLVDAEGRIVANNQQLGALVYRRSTALIGTRYEPETFWDELGIIDHSLFIDRLKQIEADHSRSAQERVETRAGTFLFQGIPVHDEQGELVGRLWVVQEITPLEQNQRLLDLQGEQLAALKQLGQNLCDVETVDELLVKASEQLHEIFGVESVGIALRDSGAGVRSRQMINSGPGPYLLESNRALLQAVERHLMPQLLGNQGVTFWTDLRKSLPWGQAFSQAGCTCVAGCPLQGAAGDHGILWIAQRGGERLDRHHLYLLETLAPMLAARVEFAQLREQLRKHELADNVTDLPSETEFRRYAHRLANRPGYTWSLIVINMDRFRELNDLLPHAEVDAVLRETAELLLRLTRKSNYVARLGGASFGILLPGVDLEGAEILANRLRTSIAELSVDVPDRPAWPVTCSCGVASCPSESPIAERIVGLGFARMQIARQQGMDRVVSSGDPSQLQAG